MIKSSYTIKTDKGWSATVFIHADEDWHVKRDIPISIVSTELQFFFSRLFGTAFVKIIAEDCSEKNIYEHHLALLERDKAILAKYEAMVAAVSQKIELAKKMNTQPTSP